VQEIITSEISEVQDLDIPVTTEVKMTTMLFMGKGITLLLLKTSLVSLKLLKPIMNLGYGAGHFMIHSVLLKMVNSQISTKTFIPHFSLIHVQKFRN
jgi:hypothetical protein